MRAVDTASIRYVETNAILTDVHVAGAVLNEDPSTPGLTISLTPAGRDILRALRDFGDRQAVVLIEGRLMAVGGALSDARAGTITLRPGLTHEELVRIEKLFKSHGTQDQLSGRTR